MKVFFIIGIFFSTSLFAASDADLREALSTQVCLTKLKLEIEDYKKIPNNYLHTEAEKRPIETIYEELQKLQEGYFKALIDWRESYNKEARDLNELGTMINSLNQSNPLTQKLMSEEENLLRLIRSHELITKERLLSLSKALENCPSNNEILADLKMSLGDFSKRLTQMKDVVAKSQAKRTLFLEASKKAIRLELETKYAQKSKTELYDLQKKLASLKLAMDLNVEMDNYYRSLAQAKMSYSTLLNIYLQYEAPLAIIHSALSKGEEFRGRIEGLFLTPDAKSVMLKNLDQYLAPLLRSLKKTIEEGPEMKLSRQKVMASEYKKVATQLSVSCLPTIITFENSPTDSNYAAIIETCKKAVIR